ncbi:MAG: trehalose-6-phosphate synthase [Paeniglutamicibacter terrestris]
MNAEQQNSSETGSEAPGYDFIVVANRLPVDRVQGENGELSWRRAPGGLVTAIAPVMQESDGAWIGWHGGAGEELEPFENEGIHLIPVPLNEEDLELYYEGFSNSTLWPLYHDVIVPPEFHRTWWDSYKKVNRRFADATAKVAAHGATVWVQDYQLQLVPKLLREARPDLRIGFFNHIPFPSPGIFSQLPWRKQILEGLAGADVVGFQRTTDASNFLRCMRRFTDRTVKGSMAIPPVATEAGETNGNICRAEAHPISIDTQQVAELAHDPEIIARAKQIRQELGNPKTVLLGVDRLDYTKGIRHRLKAYGELLADGEIQVGEACMVQVASPSRENVERYQQLKDQVELMVGNLNGEHDTMEHTAIRYLHHSYPLREMIALYLAADIMLVTSLRDGMNLVAKEFVAAHTDNTGMLVLSEFTGAADQLTQSVLVNPHDIDGMKSGILRALRMDPQESARRMRRMRRHLREHNVSNWSKEFLVSLGAPLPVDTLV